MPLSHPISAFKKLSKTGVKIPLVKPEFNQETNWKVSYEKVENIQVVGSWPVGVSVLGREKSFGVDLAVEMPAVSSFLFNLLLFVSRYRGVLTQVMPATTVLVPGERLSRRSVLS